MWLHFHINFFFTFVFTYFFNYLILLFFLYSSSTLYPTLLASLSFRLCVILYNNGERYSLSSRVKGDAKVFTQHYKKSGFFWRLKLLKIPKVTTKYYQWRALGRGKFLHIWKLFVTTLDVATKGVFRYKGKCFLENIF